MQPQDDPLTIDDRQLMNLIGLHELQHHVARQLRRYHQRISLHDRIHGAAKIQTAQ